jgi:hypothetical protein
MMLRLLTPALVLLSVYAPVGARTQSEATKTAQPAAIPAALVVEVTISRYQGDKRLSSLPYTLSVTPDKGTSTLRVGGQIPIPTAPLPVGNVEAKPAQSYAYRDIGTNLDITAVAADDGRYRVSLAVEESSVYPPADASRGGVTVAGAPAFRSLRSSNAVLLRDGQTVEYVAATDRVTGETARISVKLTVLK